MNKINQDIIKLICKYLPIYYQNLFRQCSNYLSKYVGHEYFSYKTFNIKKINKNNKHHFRLLVHKYNLTISVYNVSRPIELYYLNTLNVKSISLIAQPESIYSKYGLKHKYALKKTKLYVEYFLPNTIEKLKNYFPKKQINKIPLKKLLPNLQVLRFHDQFDQSINKKIFPKTLKKLKFGHYFNQLILKDTLPNTLKYLEFGCHFNKPINELPSGLKVLKLSEKFNSPITNLPELEEISFDSNFNQPIDKLPPTLKKLTLPHMFNQKIDMLPNSLTSLTIRTDSKQIKKIVLPLSLQELNITKMDSDMLDHALFTSLKNLIKLRVTSPMFLLRTFQIDFIRYFSNLKILIIGNAILHKNTLPTTLHTLIFEHDYNFPFINDDILPKSLTTLEFGTNFNQPIEYSKYLENNTNYSGSNVELCSILPPNLLKLRFGYEFNQPIMYLPLTLEILEFGEKFNSIIKSDIITPSLKILTFGDKFNQIIPENMLTNSLQFLLVGNNFNKKINGLIKMSSKIINEFPKNVRNCILKDYNKLYEKIFYNAEYEHELLNNLMNTNFIK